MDDDFEMEQSIFYFSRHFYDDIDFLNYKNSTSKDMKENGFHYNSKENKDNENNIESKKSDKIIKK